MIKAPRACNKIANQAEDRLLAPKVKNIIAIVATGKNQNITLNHIIFLTLSGEESIIQKARPSRDTLGKTKRVHIAVAIKEPMVQLAIKIKFFQLSLTIAGRLSRD